MASLVEGGDVIAGADYGAIPRPEPVDINFAAAVAAAAAQALPLRLQAGTYVFLRGVDLTGISELILEGSTVFDFSSATRRNGFPRDAFLFVGGGELAPLPPLDTDVAEGGRTLDFADPPNLSVGDWINIYNPTDGSYHASRPVYRAGEWARVAGVSGKRATLQWPSDASYRAADVDVYRHPMRYWEIVGGPLLVVESTHRALRDLAGIKLKLLQGSDFSALRTAGESAHAEIVASMCVGCYGRDMEVHQHRDAGVGTNYGLSVANCDSCTFQGTFHGNRHGATTSGTDDIGAVPSRRLLLEGTFSRPANGNGSVGAFACHANVEKSEIRGSFVGGAVVAGGNRMSYRGEVVTPAIGIYGGELSGLDHDFSGMRIRSLGDPTPAARGVIDFGGNGNSIDGRTRRGGTINLTRVRLDAPNAGTMVKIRNRGYSGEEPIILDMRGMQVERSAAAVSDFTLTSVSGDKIASVLIDGLENKAGALWGVDAATHLQGRETPGT